MGVRGGKILQQLPDIPRWIYARWMILSGQARIYADEKAGTSSSIIQHPTNGLTCVIGKPGTELVHRALSEEGLAVRIITYVDNDRYIENLIPGWTRSPAYLHLLENTVPEINHSGQSIRFLESDDISEAIHIPDELRREYLDAMLHSPVAALFIDNKPVSFCYAAAESESLWDISVDTLEDYRNRGYALLTVSFMIEHMSEKGKRPVWGAEESNHPSKRLAQKLGFKPVDTIFLYSKDNT